MLICSDEKFNIVWFRRNLRFDDNLPLALASKSTLPILPIFIFDSDILNQLDNPTDLRVNFIHKTIKALDGQLKKFRSAFLVLQGRPQEIFDSLFRHSNIHSLFFSKDFEPLTIRRDKEIELLASENGVQVINCVDHLIHHPADVTKSDGSPYRVYTPYFKQWLSKFHQKTSENINSKIEDVNWLKHKAIIPELDSFGFESMSWDYPSSFTSDKTIDNYGANRDIPAKSANSRLGIHLRFGTISIRKLVSQAMRSNDITFLKQLVWREFFVQIMYFFPESANTEFKPKYRNMPWIYSEEYFSKWKTGQTGIPLVDAGMRQLNQTGTMHNRVRMITASWLTKNLLHDWRLGERYFASKLLDFELASNIGSWQWVAGTGCDAAPYFRIFNPMTQAMKFDPDRAYIKKWVPEIDNLSYPAPMIDYKLSRIRCLEFYKKYMG